LEGIDEMTEKFENYGNILNRYENKAEKLREAHSDLYAKYKTLSDRVTVFTIILSALITFLSLTDLSKILNPLNLNDYTNKISPYFSLLLALFGFTIFVTTLSNYIFGWQDKYLKHESGVRLLTNYITNVKDLADSLDKESLIEAEIGRKIEEINEKYLSICEILPLIPDQEFLDSKQRYLIKRKISEELEKDPCTDTDIKEYLKKCKKNRKMQN